MNQKAVILGAGESGTGAAILAALNGFSVWVSDVGTIKENYRKILIENHIPFEQGGHSENNILDADLAILSPGIPLSVPIVRKIKALGIPVISEIEFAGRYTRARKICITGSNGKTTTTMLTYHLLKNGGLNVGLAGNVGKSFALQVATENFDWYVLEISSFQLDCMFDFKADIAVLTNITPDHLDRYDYNLTNYIESKFRITRNQTAVDAFVYCLDDEISVSEMKGRSTDAKIFTFTAKDNNQGANAWISSNYLHFQINDKQFSMSLEELALQGRHNHYNTMAAGIPAMLTEIRNESIRQALSSFENIEHRLEFVARIHGIDFINDSKATNTNSTWWALESMNSPVIWIAGGIDKGNDYLKLEELVSKKVKTIICIGVDNNKLIEHFIHKVEVVFEVEAIEEAVNLSYSIAKTNDVVLLSPACASFDRFSNYEERGNRFKQAVRNL